MRKLIYIMGCAHCGSTLLTTLLGRHSQIATVGELKLTAVPDDPDYRCGCGERLSECGFWKRVARACGERGEAFGFPDTRMHYSDGTRFGERVVGTMIRGRGFEFLRTCGLRIWPTSRRLVRRLNRRSAVVVDAVCAVEGKKVFLDGSKDPTRLRHLVESGEFDVRPIYLVRDGRAITASYKKRNPNVAHCLGLWKSKAVECESLVDYLGDDSILTLRYEDLCRDVAGTLAAIFRFAGVTDESEACLGPTAHASRHIIGHASRLSHAKEVTLREEWRRLLTEEDLEDYWNVDDGLNPRHGYQRTEDPAGSVPVGADPAPVKQGNPVS